MAVETLTVAGKPMPLDLLLFKRLKREVPGLVEQVYVANYGLADFGPILPVGTKVRVEMPALGPTRIARKIVNLTG